MEVDSDSDDEIIEQLFKKGLMQTRKRNTLKSKAVLDSVTLPPILNGKPSVENIFKIKEMAPAVDEAFNSEAPVVKKTRKRKCVRQKTKNLAKKKSKPLTNNDAMPEASISPHSGSLTTTIKENLNAANQTPIAPVSLVCALPSPLSIKEASIAEIQISHSPGKKPIAPVSLVSTLQSPPSIKDASTTEIQRSKSPGKKPIAPVSLVCALQSPHSIKDASTAEIQRSKSPGKKPITPVSLVCALQSPYSIKDASTAETQISHSPGKKPIAPVSLVCALQSPHLIKDASTAEIQRSKSPGKKPITPVSLVCALQSPPSIKDASTAEIQISHSPGKKPIAPVSLVSTLQSPPSIKDASTAEIQRSKSPGKKPITPVSLVCALQSPPSIKDASTAEIQRSNSPRKKPIAPVSLVCAPPPPTPSINVASVLNSNLEHVNINSLQFIEKVGDQFIELRSAMEIPSTFQDVLFMELQDLTSLTNIDPPLPATTQEVDDVSLAIDEQNKEHEKDIMAIVNKSNPSRDVPLLLNLSSDELLEYSLPLSITVAPVAAGIQSVIQNELLASSEVSHIQLSSTANESFEAPICASPLSPSLLEIPGQRQQNLQHDDVPHHGDMTENKKRKNKATKDPKLWKRNETKEKREKGESYLGYRRDKKVGPNDKKFKVIQDVFKPARSMKPTCTSSFCRKSKLRACGSVSTESRQQIFFSFWKTMSWEQRRAYVCSHVTKTVKKVTKSIDSKRGDSQSYFLTVGYNRLQVCKKMFMATLGVKEWFIRYWVEKTHCAMPPNIEESQKGKIGPKKTESTEYASEFLMRLPKMPSHYCRASTSKLYLEPIFTDMTELYKVYKNTCESDSKLSRKLFNTIFEKLNIGLFHPKKDQCDLCCSFKTGNISKEDYDSHIRKKVRARAEKTTDKLFAQAKKCHVFTQDVESVKLAPMLQASAIYFKTKLCVHNFTIYNLENHDVMCYWFDESNSTLEASVFASCVVEYICNTLKICPLPVILYSDGCSAQNRNAILSNALLRVAIENKVLITQKYLEKGHTQMECDSVHSAIECKVKGKEIYLPEQYVAIAKNTRLKEGSKPYDAKLLDYSFFIDFSKDLIYKSIRKKAGDPVVTDLRALEYNPNGTIKYKINFDEDFKPLPLRPTPLHRIKPIDQLPKLFTERIPISNRKYKDLQDLKSVIPERCHAFYDQLPHD